MSLMIDNVFPDCLMLKNEEVMLAISFAMSAQSKDSKDSKKSIGLFGKNASWQFDNSTLCQKQRLQNV